MATNKTQQLTKIRMKQYLFDDVDTGFHGIPSTLRASSTPLIVLPIAVGAWTRNESDGRKMEGAALSRGGNFLSLQEDSMADPNILGHQGKY